MRYFFLAFVAAVLLVLAMAGWRGQHTANRPIEFFPDMVRQMKVKPQSPSGFFADGVGPRRSIEGTVPMGFEIPTAPVPIVSKEAITTQNAAMVEHPTYAYTESGDYYNTGKMGATWGTGIPVDVTHELLEKGRERFTINCAICHGATGGGNGVISKYGLAGIANYHDDKYLKMPDGQIFNTITNGYQTMNGYGTNIAVRDRWAIVCYVRALQKAQNVTIDELSKLSPEQAKKVSDSK